MLENTSCVLGDALGSPRAAGCTLDVNCNRDLVGLTSLQVLDKVVAAAGARGIYVMFDMHSFEPDAFGSNGLW